MNFPPNFIPWLWSYFAVFGTFAIIFLALTFWTWMKVMRQANAVLRHALIWNACGYVALFAASWFACGIGGPPGNLLSTNPEVMNLSFARMAAMSGMFFSVLGWIFIWIGMRAMLKAASSK